MNRTSLFLLGCLVLAGSFVGGAMSGQLLGQTAQAGPAKVVSEQGLQLVDGQGRLRAEITFHNVDGSEHPGFFLYAQDGKEKARVTTVPPYDQPGVALTDIGAFESLWLGFDQDGALLMAPL